MNNKRDSKWVRDYLESCKRNNIEPAQWFVDYRADEIRRTKQKLITLFIIGWIIITVLSLPPINLINHDWFYPAGIIMVGGVLLVFATELL